MAVKSLGEPHCPSEGPAPGRRQPGGRAKAEGLESSCGKAAGREGPSLGVFR